MWLYFFQGLVHKLIGLRLPRPRAINDTLSTLPTLSCIVRDFYLPDSRKLDPSKDMAGPCCIPMNVDSLRHEKTHPLSVVAAGSPLDVKLA